MKQRSIGLWQLMGFAVTSFGGTLLHFLYDWTGGAIWIALFSGVNESTWEHMKLLFFPMLAFAIVQRLFFRDFAAFWSVKLKGTLLGLSLVPIIFYTYNGVIGKSPDWFNISIFFVAAAIAYAYEAKQFKVEHTRRKRSWWSFIALCVMAVLFVVFTFATPKIGIFLDPLTGTYGI